MKTIIANWKMNVATRGAVALARGTLLSLRGKKVLPELIICPPYVALADVRKSVARSRVALGAQNVCWEAEGSYTGEISARMLSEVGVSHVIVGHSERRAHAHEDDYMINKKVIAALGANITPILCVGESDNTDLEAARELIGTQLRGALQGIILKGNQQLIVGYEPVWAIGNGKPATPAYAAEMHAFILRVLKELHPSFDGRVRVVYGGSVNKENAYAFLREDAVDGLLVGSASVKLTEFSEIIQSAVDIMEGTLEAQS